MKIFNNKYYHFLWLMRNERRPKEKLRQIQSHKLKRLIEHAFRNVPFYRDMFKKLGLEPENITSIDDLQKIPIIDKDDFHRHNDAYLMDKRIRKKRDLIPINTSGSSGLSLRFYIDRQYNKFRKAQNLRSYYTNGRKARSKVVQLVNTPVSKHKWFQRVGFFVEQNVYSDSDLDRQIGIIKKIEPAIIQGFGSCLALLASKIDEENISIPVPQVIFTYSELLTKQMREKIEKSFNTQVIDLYGTFETGIIAYQCDRYEGYHIAADCVIMEFIRNGKRVGPDETGEIVCTVLDNFTMPFIRYNIKDVGRFTEKNCSCGRTLPLMEMIDGRSDHFAVYENGLVKSPRNFLGLFDPLVEFLYEYHIIQDEINKFTVQIVPNHRFNARIEQKIKENLRREFPNAQIDIKIVDSISRDRSGKLQAFKSLVGKN